MLVLNKFGYVCNDETKMKKIEFLIGNKLFVISYKNFKKITFKTSIDYFFKYFIQ